MQKRKRKKLKTESEKIEYRESKKKQKNKKIKGLKNFQRKRNPNQNLPNFTFKEYLIKKKVLRTPPKTL